MKDVLEIINNLEKYYEFKKQFPETVDNIIATLKELDEENKKLRTQLKSVCNELMERRL